MPMHQALNLALKYEYRVTWAGGEDACFAARVTEWPSLAAHGSTQEEALREAREVVAFAIEDCEAQGDPYPQPLSLNTYSGKLNLRMTPELHRAVASEAKLLGLSINQLILHKLSGVSTG